MKELNIDFSFFDNLADLPTEPQERPTEPRSEPPARFDGQTAKGSQGAPQPPQQEDRDQVLLLAYKIIKRDKLKREITEGVIKQIENDLQGHAAHLPTLLCYMAEALDRASGQGDQYIKRVDRALKENGYT